MKSLSLGSIAQGARRVPALALCFLVLSARFCHADFVTISTLDGYSWNRPTTTGGTATFQAWEAFTSTTGPNAPGTVFGVGTGDPSTVSSGTANNNLGFGGPAGATWNTINSAGVPNAFNTTPVGSFVTSGGNIYSPAGIVTPRIEIPNNIDNLIGNQSTGFTSLILQVRTQGSFPDYNSIRLTDPTSGSLLAPNDITVLATASLGGFGGTLQDTLIRFLNVPGNADLYTIDFAAASSSMSLDRLAVDTFFSNSIISAPAIPEPNVGILAGVATLVLGYRRRTRRV